MAKQSSEIAAAIFSEIKGHIAELREHVIAQSEPVAGQPGRIVKGADLAPLDLSASIVAACEEAVAVMLDQTRALVVQSNNQIRQEVKQYVAKADDSIVTIDRIAAEARALALYASLSASKPEGDTWESYYGFPQPKGIYDGVKPEWPVVISTWGIQ